MEKILAENWNEKEKKDLRDWLIGVLTMHSPVTIVFQKKDGTDRTMQCTLKEGIVKPYEAKSTTIRKEKSDKIISVWDIEKEDWRSFGLDTIKQINFSLV